MNRGLATWLPNALGFQIVWMAAVAGAARDGWWLGPLALALFAVWQLAGSRVRGVDLALMALAGGLGFLIDSLWVQLGWIAFASPGPWAGAAPLWIVAMWMGFALTLNHSLALLGRHPLLAAACGACAGPLAYWIAAETWQAADVAPGPQLYLALALAWGVLLPALLQLARRLRGMPALRTA